jgi:hypothetical protein
MAIFSREGPLNRSLCAAIGIAGLLTLGTGCGSGTPEPPKDLTSANAGPNARLKFKDEYKQMLGKDGQLLWKPSESSKRPPGVPKS